MDAKKPLYSQIQDYVIDRIEEGQWPPHYQIPPERELAGQFQVSRITAKHAMLKLVNEGWLYRHRGKGTFVADREREQAVRSSDTLASPDRAGNVSGRKIIGFIMPWMEAHYSSQLISGVEAALGQLDYHFLFKRISSREEESRAIQDFLGLPVDGIIIVASQGEQHFNDDIVRLVLNKHPVVLVERTMQDIRTNGVYCNTEEIGQLMVDHLRKRGAEQIGLVTYPPLYTLGVSDRVKGIQSALAQNGMAPMSESRILSVPTSVIERSSSQDVPPELIDYLKKNRDLDGIATVDALLARFVGTACAKLGLTKMRIVCCDQPLLYPNCVPPIAYVDQSPFEMGTIAARMIVDSIVNRTEPRKEKISPRLVELSG
ncbi:GntR family transcriptional regulator [Paenibacillaceae bacterium WGS1546]|uniref:GntR family transcriptional regulator n=1 Tax=Cohnella sp. WGS1546 TaxID=3366810 RepID=UPI00372D3529